MWISEQSLLLTETDSLIYRINLCKPCIEFGVGDEAIFVGIKHLKTSFQLWFFGIVFSARHVLGFGKLTIPILIG